MMCHMKIPDKIKTFFSTIRESIRKLAKHCHPLPCKKKIKTKWSRKKKIAVTVSIIFISGVLFFALSNLLIMAQSDRIHFSTENIPECHAALVLGCSPTVHKRANYYFFTRIDAAAKIYKSGKVKKLLLSGDNGRKGYNEPEAMRQALIACGVPDSDIYCDYAGFSTLDSIIRAKQIFGQQKFVVVSQPFHCERAIFLAKIKGLDVCGFAAEDITAWRWRVRRYIREFLARPAALLDLLTFRSARFGGIKIDMTVPQTKAEE